MERTYVFNQDGNNGNGGGSKFDIMAMLPNLMGSKGVDPGLLALLNQGRGSQDQWGGSWWFIWIILLWFCWGGNGFGNRSKEQVVNMGLCGCFQNGNSHSPLKSNQYVSITSYQ